MPPIRLWLICFTVLMAGHACIACLVPSPPLRPITPRKAIPAPPPPILEDVKPTVSPQATAVAIRSPLPSRTEAEPTSSAPMPIPMPMPPTVVAELPDRISGAHLFVVVDAANLRTRIDDWNAILHRLGERRDDLAGESVWFVGRQQTPMRIETLPPANDASKPPTLADGVREALRLVALADREKLRRVSILWASNVNPDNADLKGIDWKKFPEDTTIIRYGDTRNSTTLQANGIGDLTYPDFPTNMVRDLYPK